MKENVKTFVKKHWKAIAINTAIVGGMVIWMASSKVEVPDVSKLKNAYEKGQPFITRGKYKLSDLGKLGIEMIEHDPKATMDSVVDMIDIYYVQ